jgi:hypothetical protein
LLGDVRRYLRHSKSKLTPIDSFEHLCDGSELYTVGVVEGLGLAGPQEDERATVPDLESMVILPWEKSRAWFSSDSYYHGEPYAGDPRGILRRVLERANRLGFSFNLGMEPEFYVLKPDANGVLGPITKSRFLGPNACYDVTQATESSAFLDPLAAYMKELDCTKNNAAHSSRSFDGAWTEQLADRRVDLRARFPIAIGSASDVTPGGLDLPQLAVREMRDFQPVVVGVKVRSVLAGMSTERAEIAANARAKSRSKRGLSLMSARCQLHSTHNRSFASHAWCSSAHASSKASIETCPSASYSRLRKKA